MSPSGRSLTLTSAQSDRQLGWWFSCLARSYKYLLDDHGYRIDDVYIHFRGSGLAFRSHRFVIRLTYDQEGSQVGCDLYSAADYDAEQPRLVTAQHLLEVRAPDRVWAPPDTPWSRSQVEGVFESWAAGLREYAADVIAGRIPTGVSWETAW